MRAPGLCHTAVRVELFTLELVAVVVVAVVAGDGVLLAFGCGGVDSGPAVGSLTRLTVNDGRLEPRRLLGIFLPLDPNLNHPSNLI